MGYHQEEFTGSEPQDQSTQKMLEKAIGETLSRWKFTEEEVLLRETPIYPSGHSIDSVSKKNAALAIENGIEAGEIVFTVADSENVPPGQLFITGVIRLPNQTREGVLTAGIFPADLPIRCNRLNRPIALAVEQCFGETLTTDMMSQFKNNERGSYPSHGKVLNFRLRPWNT